MRKCSKCGQIILNKKDEICFICGNILEEYKEEKKDIKNNINKHQERLTILKDKQNNKKYEFNNEFTKINNDFIKQYSEKKIDYEKFNKASIMMGIISILILPLSLFLFPFSLIGIILGIIYKKKTNKTSIGVLLNIFPIIISLFIISFGLFSTGNFINNIIENINIDNNIKINEKYNCYSIYSFSKKYTKTIEFNNYNEYKIGSFNDYDNTYEKGKYEINESNLSNNNEEYYMDLYISEKYKDGTLEKLDESEKSLKIIKEDNKYKFTFNRINIYYCERDDNIE